MRPRHLLPLTSFLLISMSACGPCSRSAPEIPDEKPAVVASPPALAPPPPEPRRAFAITSTEGLPADLIGVHPMWEVARPPGVVRGHDIPVHAERLYPDGRRFAFGTSWGQLPCTLDAATMADVEAGIRSTIARNILKPTAEATQWIDPPDGFWVLTHRAWLDGAETIFVMAWNGDETVLPTNDVDVAIIKGLMKARDAAGPGDPCKG